MAPKTQGIAFFLKPLALWSTLRIYRVHMIFSIWIYHSIADYPRQYKLDAKKAILIL